MSNVFKTQQEINIFTNDGKSPVNFPKFYDTILKHVDFFLNQEVSTTTQVTGRGPLGGTETRVLSNLSLLELYMLNKFQLPNNPTTSLIEAVNQATGRRASSQLVAFIDRCNEQILKTTNGDPFSSFETYPIDDELKLVLGDYDKIHQIVGGNGTRHGSKEGSFLRILYLGDREGNPITNYQQEELVVFSYEPAIKGKEPNLSRQSNLLTTVNYIYEHLKNEPWAVVYQRNIVGGNALDGFVNAYVNLREALEKTSDNRLNPNQKVSLAMEIMDRLQGLYAETRNYLNEIAKETIPEQIKLIAGYGVAMSLALLGDTAVKFLEAIKKNNPVNQIGRVSFYYS